MITITFSTYITVNTDGSDHLWRVNQVHFPSSHHFKQCPIHSHIVESILV